MLAKLPLASRAAYTEMLLPLALTDAQWIATHTSVVVNQYPELKEDSPSWAQIREHGKLRTSLGVAQVRQVVGSEFAEWNDIFAVARFKSTDWPFLQLPGSFAALGSSSPRWDVAFHYAAHIESLERAASFYAHAVEVLATQGRPLRCRIGTELGTAKPQDITATHDRVVFDLLCGGEVPALLTPNARATELLIQRWGLQPADAAAAVGRWIPSGPPIPAMELFPQVADAEVTLVPCSEVWFERPSPEGLVREDRPFLIEERTLHYRDTLSDEEVFELLVQELSVELREEAPPEDDRVSSLLDSVVAAATVREKISVLLGAERLRRRIPEGVLHTIDANHSAGSESLAAVALSLYGTSVLNAYKLELESLGLNPPAQWAGGARAVEFVRALGFRDEFAGTSAAEIRPWLDVGGPVELPPLHEFQRVLCSKMESFFAEPQPGRALLSLPTGAGKTRVTVEAVVSAFRAGTLSGTVLWIADRDELCEQAFQTWQIVWQAIGPARSTIRLSRLWGRTNDRVVEVVDRPHVVVATYQSLKPRMATTPWLTRPSCVIIDEAHGSTTPSFTTILREAGLTANETALRLIGLSATPFRGDHEETVRLVNRYGRRRFDHGVFPEDDAYPYLRQLGILSEVSHSLIEAADPELTAEEIAELKQLSSLPASVERRMAGDVNRNEAIVRAIESRPEDWPVLVYAISVAHAQVLAAELARRGIRSAAITGESPRDARRNAIRSFKDGQIRVLTNYGVLTTGFDAPRVRSVFVVRPIFSRSLYQQIIGRGLRGPANGGTEMCEIVNVNDNFEQYGQTLAFRHFEYLWEL